MTTPRAQIKQIQTAQLGSLNDFAGSDGNFAVTTEEVAKLHRRTVDTQLTDANTANQDAAEYIIFRATNGPVRVKSADVTTPIDVAADAADKGTFTLAKRTAGAAAVAVATRATDVAGGALTAFTPSALTLVPAAVDLALNDVLTLKLIKAGAGQKFAGATAPVAVTVTVEEI